MAKVMSKSELVQKIAEQHSNRNMARKDVKAVIESLAAIGYKELNKSGAFPVSYTHLTLPTILRV